MGKDDLMTVKEIAEAKSISERMVRYNLAETGLEPEMVDSSAHGKPKLFYSLDKYEAVTSHLSDQKLISQLSADTQRTVAYGFIERYGTQEERQALRDFIDKQDKLIEYKDKLIKEQQEDIKLIAASCAIAEDEMHAAKREYSKLLRYVPDKYKSKEQRDWESAIPTSQLAWMFGKR
jgi:hypothetical protein